MITTTTLMNVGADEVYTSDRHFRPDEIPTDAVKVTFRDVAINHVPHRALENLTQCRELEFIDTNISVIDSHAWHGLDNLAELTLSQNHLENLEQGHFKHLGNLQRLHLSQNRIVNIKNSTFEEMSSLRYLELMDNQINTLVTGVFHGLTSVIHLLLRNNRISVIGNIFTVRNEVAKVMFLHLSVILFTGGLSQCMLGYHHLGAGTAPPGPGTSQDQTPPWDQAPPRTRHLPRSRYLPDQACPQSRPPGTPPSPAADGYCCGQYTSYWNAFLLNLILGSFVNSSPTLAENLSLL